MNKKTWTLIGVHAALLAGITAGYICMYKKLKEPKLNCLSSEYD